MLVFEFTASFVSGLSAMTMIFAMIGGLLSMIWYLLIARKLFQMGSYGHGDTIFQLNPGFDSPYPSAPVQN